MIMPVNMSVQFDCEELLKKFDFLKKEKGYFLRKITRAVLKPIKNETRRSIRGHLKRTTNRTAKYTDIWAFKDGSGRLFLGSFYGRLMDSGYYISPKHKKVLRFKIGDKWFSKKDSIFVPGRDISRSIWEKGTANSEMSRIAEETMRVEFEKWAKK